MKKNFFLVLLGMFMINTAFSQMSFKGNTIQKSAFDLTEKKANFLEGNSSDSKVFISDEEDDMTRRRRRSRRGGGDYNNSLKMNPLSMIFGVFGVQYERKISDNISLGLTTGLYSRSTGIAGAMEYKYSGFSFGPECRYYFDEAIEGWYGSAFFTLTMINEKMSFTGSEDMNNKITVYGGGVVAGHQWIWGGFTLDVFGGVGYTDMSYTYDDDFTEGTVLEGGLSFSGVLPSIGTSIGYSF